MRNRILIRQWYRGRLGDGEPETCQPGVGVGGADDLTGELVKHLGLFCGIIHFVVSNDMVLSYFISNWYEWYEWYGFLLNFAGTFSMLIWLRIVVCGWCTLYTVAACHVLTGFSVRVSMLHHVTISLAHRRFICSKVHSVYQTRKDQVVKING